MKVRANVFFWSALHCKDLRSSSSSADSRRRFLSTTTAITMGMMIATAAITTYIVGKSEVDRGPWVDVG